jgi:sec-independent protein translocase protein TatA
MSRIGPFEILLIVVIVLLLFGGKKIPELMRGIGQGMKEFRKAARNEDSADGSSKATEQDKK